MLDTRHIILCTLLARSAAIITIKETRIVCLIVSLEREVLRLIKQFLAVETAVIRLATGELWPLRQFLRVTERLLGSVFIVEVAEEEPDGIAVDEDHLLNYCVSV